MDPFMERMLERAKARREKLEQKLPPSEQGARHRSPLIENNQSKFSPSKVYSSPKQEKQPTPESKPIVTKVDRTPTFNKSSDICTTSISSCEDSDIAVKINIVHQNNVQVEVQVEERQVTLSEYLKEQEHIENCPIEDKENKEIPSVMSVKPTSIDEEFGGDIADSKINLREGVKNRLRKLGKLYSEEGQLSSPIHQSGDINLAPEKLETPQKKKDSFSKNRVEKQDEIESKPKARKFGRLAALADEINNWEDDTSHHNFKSTTSSSSASNQKKPTVTTNISNKISNISSKFITPSAANTISPNSKDNKTQILPSKPAQSSRKSLPKNNQGRRSSPRLSKINESATPTKINQSISSPKNNLIKFGDNKNSPVKFGENKNSPARSGVSTRSSLAKDKLPEAKSDKTPSSNTTVSSKSRQSITPNNRTIGNTTPNNKTTTGNATPNGKTPLKGFSPHVVSSSPKKADQGWDKSILKDLESQGFKRASVTQSRLVYDFGARRDAMAAACAEQPLDRKPSLKKRPAPPPPPPPQQQQPPLEDDTSSEPSSEYATPEADRREMPEDATSPPVRRDPLLMSVREKKAMFEQGRNRLQPPKPPVEIKKPVVNVNSKPKIELKPSNIAPVHLPINKTSTANALLNNKRTISEQEILDKRKTEIDKDMKVIQNRFNRPDLDAIEHDNQDEDGSSESSPLMGNSVHKSSASNLNAKRPPLVNSPKVLINHSSDNSSQQGDVIDAVAVNQPTKRSSIDSPLVVSALDDVKRIKVVQTRPGGLYPCLSDVEGNSEEEHQSCPKRLNDSSDSSINEHEDEDWGNTSFGREVLQAVGVKKDADNSVKKLLIKNLDRSTEKKKAIKRADESSDSSFNNSNLDDLLDEAFDFEDADVDGPTPPKQNKNSNGTKASHSFYYKRGNEMDDFKSPLKTPPKKDASRENNHQESNKPLVHTVSFYRKQQNQGSQPATPVRVVRAEYDVNEEEEKEKAVKAAQISAQESRRRVKELLEEVAKQNTIVSQASQALNLCVSTIEFSGSTEQAEGERLLLLATHRRQACLHEVQRIQVEGVNTKSSHIFTLNIQELCVPLRREYVRQLNAEGALGHYLVCLIKCQERVMSTSLVKTAPDSFTVTFPDKFRLEGLDGEFKITVEVYALQASKEILPHDIKYHIGTKKSGKLATPRKGARGADLRAPLPIQSPGGPSAVRSPAMQPQGYCIFSAQQINRTNFTLTKSCGSGPVEGCLRVKITCERRASLNMMGGVRRGFLTMFEEAGGFGAWHRRWCVLHSTDLSYWRYPDDEKKKTPMGSIELALAVTDTVGPAPRDLCARPHTLLLELSTSSSYSESSSDQTARSLIMSNGLRRHLLAADTRPERDAWAKALNESLAFIRDCNDAISSYN